MDYGPRHVPIIDMELGEEDKRVLNIFSGYLAQNLDHIWHEEIMDKLDRADGLLVRSAGTESMLDSIARLASELLEADNCLIRVENNGIQWVIKALIEGVDDSVGHCPLPTNVGICGRAISTRDAEFVVDVELDKEFMQLSKYMMENQDNQWEQRGNKIKSVAIGVLLHAENVIGTITLEYYSKKGFTNSERNLFHRFCNKVAIALFRAEEFTQAIQNMGQIIGLVGSALDHKTKGIGRALKPIADSLDKFIESHAAIDTSSLSHSIETLGGLQSELENMMALIKELPVCRDVNEICRYLIKIYKARLDYNNIHPQLQLAGNIPRVLSEEISVSIVFALLNLISNAFDSMSDDNAKDDHILRLTTYYEPENWRVIIVVEDNGEGISNDNLPLIFTPGVTTKEGHSGMGLPLVRTLIENLGGAVKIDTVEHKYARFTLSIPWEVI